MKKQKYDREAELHKIEYDPDNMASIDPENFQEKDGWF